MAWWSIAAPFCQAERWKSRFVGELGAPRMAAPGPGPSPLSPPAPGWPGPLMTTLMQTLPRSRGEASFDPWANLVPSEWRSPARYSPSWRIGSGCRWRSHFARVAKIQPRIRETSLMKRPVRPRVGECQLARRTFVILLGKARAQKMTRFGSSGILPIRHNDVVAWVYPPELVAAVTATTQNSIGYDSKDACRCTRARGASFARRSSAAIDVAACRKAAQRRGTWQSWNDWRGCATALGAAAWARAMSAAVRD